MTVDLSEIEVKLIRQLLLSSVVKGEQAHYIVDLLAKFPDLTQAVEEIPQPAPQEQPQSEEIASTPENSDQPVS